MKNKIVPDNLEQWLEAILERQNPNTKFRPHIWYNKDGYILDIKTSEQFNVYSKWINPYITLVMNQEDDKIVGVKIWNYKALQNNTKKIDEADEEWVKENEDNFIYDLADESEA